MEKKKRKPFWFALGLSLFLFLTAAGFVAVDYQGRKMSFGDSQPPFHVEETADGRAELEIKVFGMEKTMDVTKIDEIWHFVCDFSCIPYK